jgi:hypothetical protein
MLEHLASPNLKQGHDTMSKAETKATTPGAAVRRELIDLDAHADGELIELCREFVENEAEFNRLCDLEADGQDVRALIRGRVDRCHELRALIAGLAGRTPEGLKAKAQVALIEFGTDGEWPSDNSEYIAWSLARDVVGDDRMSARKSPNPDAELIQICAEHVANHVAYNSDDSVLDADKNPLWPPYLATHRAIDNAEPQTMAGLVAKAKAALVEATHPDGTVAPEDCLGWAWDLADDLIRLGGGL